MQLTIPACVRYTNVLTYPQLRPKPVTLALDISAACSQHLAVIGDRPYILTKRYSVSFVHSMPKLNVISITNRRMLLAKIESFRNCVLESPLEPESAIVHRIPATNPISSNHHLKSMLTFNAN